MVSVCVWQSSTLIQIETTDVIFSQLIGRDQEKGKISSQKEEEKKTLIERDELAADRVRNRWYVGDNK